MIYINPVKLKGPLHSSTILWT